MERPGRDHKDLDQLFDKFQLQKQRLGSKRCNLHHLLWACARPCRYCLCGEDSCDALCATRAHGGVRTGTKHVRAQRFDVIVTHSSLHLAGPCLAIICDWSSVGQWQRARFIIASPRVSLVVLAADGAAWALGSTQGAVMQRLTAVSGQR
jgi:hypothetical protein